MPDDEAKKALLEALDNDIDEFIRLVETQPTLREPDAAPAQPSEGKSN